MEMRIYSISVLTLLALKISYSCTEQLQSETPLETPDIDSRFNRLDSLYALLPDDDVMYKIPDKRRSLFRFGKRRSLLRFGKRGSILRFGKRPSTFDIADLNEQEYIPMEFYDDPRDIGAYLADKRSSLFRFGKKSRATDSLFERNSDKDKSPHTPWRFGREEDYVEDSFADKHQ